MNNKNNPNLSHQVEDKNYPINSTVASLSSNVSSSSSDSEDETVSESNVENKGRLEKVSERSVAHLDSRLNGTAVPNNESSSFGDIAVESSDRVHVGSRHLYKGPVTIHQYLYNNSMTENNDVIKRRSSESVDDFVENNDERQEDFNRKPKSLKGLLRSICVCFKVNCFRPKLCLIIVSVLLLLSLLIFLILANTIPHISTTPIPTTTNPHSTTQQLSTTLIPITTNSPSTIQEPSTTPSSSTTNPSSTTLEPSTTLSSTTIQTETTQILSTTTQTSTTPNDESTPSDKPSSPSPPSKFIQLKQIGKDTVYVEWEKPDYDGGAPLRAYMIKHTYNVMSYNVNGNEQNITIDDLIIKGTYYFKIYARNDFGYSEPLTHKDGIYVADVPDRPLEFLERKQIGKDSVFLMWVAPQFSGGGDAVIESYLIKTKESRDNQWITVNSTIEEKIIVTKLEKHHKYLFRVFAKNRVGYSRPLETFDAIEIIDLMHDVN